MSEDLVPPRDRAMPGQLTMELTEPEAGKRKRRNRRAALKQLVKAGASQKAFRQAPEPTPNVCEETDLKSTSGSAEPGDSGSDDRSISELDISEFLGQAQSEAKRKKPTTKVVPSSPIAPTMMSASILVLFILTLFIGWASAAQIRVPLPEIPKLRVEAPPGPARAPTIEEVDPYCILITIGSFAFGALQGAIVSLIYLAIQCWVTLVCLRTGASPVTRVRWCERALWFVWLAFEYYSLPRSGAEEWCTVIARLAYAMGRWTIMDRTRAALARLTWLERRMIHWWAADWLNLQATMFPFRAHEASLVATVLFHFVWDFRSMLTLLSSVAPSILVCLTVLLIGYLTGFGVLAEEFACHSVGWPLRVLIALGEYLLRISNPRNSSRHVYFSAGFVVLLHLVWQAMDPAYSVLMHVLWNYFIFRCTTAKRHCQYSPIEIIEGEDLGRTYDMDVGDAEYDAEVWNCRLGIETVTYVGLLDREICVSKTLVGQTMPFCPELYNHLLSARASCSATDTPDVIRSRIVTLMRSFTALNIDRSLLSTGFVINTVEFALQSMECLIGNHKRPQDRDAPLMLYGYPLEAVKAPRADNVPVMLNIPPRRSPIDVAQPPIPCARQLFCCPDAIPPKPDARDPLMLLAGSLHRVARRTPQVNPGRLKRFRKFCRDYFQNHLQPLPPDSNLDVQVWLDSTNYSNARKAELLRVWEQFVALRKRHLMAKSFGKDEHLADYKYLRIISSRSDTYKCLVGPLVRLVEKNVFRQFPEVIKLVPLPERPAYIRSILEGVEGELFETDYTSYEASHTREFFTACMLELYLQQTRDIPAASWPRDLHCRVRQGNQLLNFKAFMLRIFEAKELSGEVDTSLNNTVPNIMLHKFFAYERAVADNVPFDVTKPLGVYEGDDGFSKMNRRAMPTERDYADFGLICKLEPRASINESSFCGIMTAEGSDALVTDVREALGTFAWSHTPDANASHKRALNLLLAKSYSYAYQYQGCPVLYPLAVSVIDRFAHDPDELLAFIKDSASGRTYDTYMRDVMIQSVSWVARHPRVEVDMPSRELVERAYGVTIDEQLRLEKLFPTLPLVGTYHVTYAVPNSWRDYFFRFVRYRSIGGARAGALAHRIPEGRYWLSGDLSMSYYSAAFWRTTCVAPGLADRPVFSQYSTPFPSSHLFVEGVEHPPLIASISSEKAMSTRKRSVQPKLELAIVKASGGKQKQQAKLAITGTRPRRRPRARARGGIVEKLSPCAADYAWALRDTQNAPLACIPSDVAPIPSFKMRTWVKGVAGVGSGGWGFITVNPQRMSGSDASPVYDSGVAYAGTTTPSTFAEGGVTARQPNAPFTSAQYNAANGLQYRLVGCCLTAWPIGAEDSLQGEFYCLHNPDDQSIANHSSTTIMAWPSSRRFPVTSARKRVTVAWTPTNANVSDYVGVYGAATSPQMCILFSGPASTASWLAYEVHAMFEVVGSSAPTVSRSHSDPQGFGAVLEAAQSQGDSIYNSPAKAVKDLLKGAYAALSDMSGPAFRLAGRYAISAAANYMMPGIGAYAGGAGALAAAAAGSPVPQIAHQVNHTMTTTPQPVDETTPPSRSFTVKYDDGTKVHGFKSTYTATLAAQAAGAKHYEVWKNEDGKSTLFSEYFD